MKTLTAFLLVCLSVLPFAHASAQSSQSELYVLKTGSTFETGCFPPCLCPVLVSQSMEGTFRLRRTFFDPLFTYYNVTEVRWAVPNSTSRISIVGSGTYRVGGELAVQQRMILDLSVNGGALQHFDSGLVPGGGNFPDITIRVSLHQEQACQDTVLQVKAGPLTASSAENAEGPPAPGIRAVTPNPFHDRTLLLVGVARTDPVAIDVFDLHGRLVRHLASEQPMSAGVHPFAWDGRADDGRESPAGIYFVRASLGEQHFFARVVRVR